MMVWFFDLLRFQTREKVLPWIYSKFWEELIRQLSLLYLRMQYHLHCLNTVIYLPWFPWLRYLAWLLWLNNGPAMGPTVAQVWVQLSHENGVVSVITKLNPSYSQVDWCRS
jgi:hypothetical protein